MEKSLNIKLVSIVGVHIILLMKKMYLNELEQMTLPKRKINLNQLTNMIGMELSLMQIKSMN